MSKKRKTRQEKIIADLRRKLQTVAYPPKETLPSPEPQKEPKIITTPSPAPALTLPPTPVALTKKDLTKTFLLAILAISLEFGLYFLLG